MNALLLRRRAMMEQQKQSEDVRFWASGNDAPAAAGSYSYLVERIQNTSFLIQGSNVYDATENLYDFRQNSQYADSTGSSVYDFGHHWKLYFDIDAYVYNGRTLDKYFLDFGSVTNANHAFGFHMGLATGNKTTVGINWKLNGNSSNPGIATLAHSYVPSAGVSQYEPVQGYYTIVDGGDGFDRLEVSINGVIERYNVKIPQVSYSPPWVQSKWVVGGAFSNGYSLPNYMRELKLVVID